MFIKKLIVRNFRLFPSEPQFELECLNIPDQTNAGSGLTVFVGENGCGKTALLDAIALPLLSYKADNFTHHDFYDPTEKVHIEVLADASFAVDGTMPKSTFRAKGFSFDAGVRARDARAYLSSVVVSDQKYIRADGVDKPKDNSPDLRVSVNNPFKGARFNENDILFLDRNRTFQTRSGTYNPTRFDRLMDDFSYQFIKSKDHNCDDLDSRLADVRQTVSNEFLENAIAMFRDISGSEIALKFIDNWDPFNRCYFAESKENNQHITLDRLGSGYEMIFSLLYSFHLSKQSGKQLIMLIDEPEIHLHPSLQERFVQVLLEFSKSAQILLTTHSPLFVKFLLHNETVRANSLTRENGTVRMIRVDERVLSFMSASEVNYLAFSLATEEYHNELYEELKYRHGDDKGIQEFDDAYFQREKSERANYAWRGHPNAVTIHTFVRNQIHHRKDNGVATVSDLKASIEVMREYMRGDI